MKGKSKRAKRQEPRCGEAVIEGGYLVIRLKVADLSAIVSDGVQASELEPMVVTDAKAFAKDLVLVMNAADAATDEGPSMLHEFFDRAVTRAHEYSTHFGSAETVTCVACHKPLPVKDGWPDGFNDSDDGLWVCRECDERDSP